MKRYADPYVAGFCLGLVVLASFAFAGRGVGVSGTFRLAAAKLWTAAAELPLSNAEASASALRAAARAAAVQTFGILVGAFLSALLARRVKLTIERGPNITNGTRLMAAFAGGTVMAAGAYLARGCTSGLALSGGALLGVGSWIFMLAAFAAAYAFAPLVRKTWH
jgi:hypothetical protein